MDVSTKNKQFLMQLGTYVYVLVKYFFYFTEMATH